ncbi:cell division protein ZapA [Fenollaria sporofastidiosus]|uniref:cell division protein ZapA n=1 Tax=Fenollaria sporofastidiosus TaxID=2811778 RepID=UPI001C000BDF|nr:cell division protein ZapA [Fenollaria sporofastidiosus]
MPERVTVHINGRDFNIRSEYDEKYVSDIAYYVNKLIKDLLANNPRLDSLMATTLATVNVTDELFKAQKKLSEYESTPINKSQEYMDLNEAYQEALNKIEKLQEELNNKADELVKTKLNTEDLYQQLSRIKEGTNSQDADAKNTKIDNNSKNKNNNVK